MQRQQRGDANDDEKAEERTFEIGHFIKYVPHDNGKWTSAVIVCYNGVSKRYDVKALSSEKGSFTVTTGKLKGGDKEQIYVIITGPITGTENVKSYRLGLDNIEDVGDGKYKVSFVGTGIGLYNIRVVMFGKESPLFSN